MPSRHVREHHLHYIWVRQHLQTLRLLTTESEPVEVLEPGSVSLDAGPDIHGCRIRIGQTLFAGDVEIHRTAPEWIAHGHHTDPRYNSVILHVLLKEPPAEFITNSENGRSIPMLVLADHLSGPVEELERDAALDEHDHRTGRIHCSGLNGRVPAPVLSAWLDALAVERFEIKLRRFEERIRELARSSARSVCEPSAEWADHGDPDDISSPDPDVTQFDLSRPAIWDQVLYEGLMEGLGYSKNRRPFLTLSTNLTLDVLRKLSSDSVQTEALLFGVAGLLPEPGESLDVEARTYVHVLRNEWSHQRQRYRARILSPAEWMPTPTRPFNAPIVRLVAARVVIGRILNEDLFRSILHAVKHESGGEMLRNRLHKLLRIDPGPFWERRVSFSRIVPQPVQPLGPARIDDLIINTIFPLALLYARLFRDGSVRNGVVNVIGRYPAAQSNTLTRRMERHLFREKVPLDSAVRQQGAVQLFNYYCSKGRCSECEVGKLVWGEGSR